MLELPGNGVFGHWRPQLPVEVYTTRVTGVSRSLRSPTSPSLILERPFLALEKPFSTLKRSSSTLVSNCRELVLLPRLLEFLSLQKSRSPGSPSRVSNSPGIIVTSVYVTWLLGQAQSIASLWYSRRACSRLKALCLVQTSSNCRPSISRTTAKQKGRLPGFSVKGQRPGSGKGVPEAKEVMAEKRKSPKAALPVLNIMMRLSLGCSLIESYSL
mmetsp:Transcript_10468/g.15532  ORF Transcript_10468/g.15532 Transcript_10468/m.15532 type:complete len:214 (-) Transcript_10468:60-701(-)